MRGLTGLVIAAGGVLLVARPEIAPWAVVAGLLLAFGPICRAYAAARGTALRAAVAWGFVSLALGVAAELAALGEPLAGGRPVAGHLAYLCCLTTLAALISVLNARTPGGGAWAILMTLLVVVFLIPWLEGPGLGRAGHGLARLRLANPWTIFFGLLVLAGVTNFLPTRYGPGAACLGAGFVVEFIGLTRLVESPTGLAVVWTAFPWTLAAAAALAGRARDRHRGPGTTRFERLWFWFRDHWGVVWGLRVMERVNRTAKAAGWPVRLGWHGLEDASEKIVPDEWPDPVPADADALLAGLLRRFATADRLEQAAGVTRAIPRAQPGGAPPHPNPPPRGGEGTGLAPPSS